MSVQFAVLASGSRGNATLIRSGAGGAGLLLDVGLGPRTLAERLATIGASWQGIAAAVLTHTHGDHVDSATLGMLAKHGIVFYCHEAHRDALNGMVGFQKLLAAGLCRDYDDRPFLAPNGVWVEPLALRHDRPTFGFRIEARPERRKNTVAIGYLADSGSWSDAMADALAEVDVLGVEFNHDVDLQRMSPRSPALISRNLGDHGHLSNRQGAEFVTAVLDRSAKSRVRHLVLLHLSQECNTWELALQSARAAVRAAGRRVTIHAALQVLPHPNLWIGPGRSTASRARRQAGAAPAEPRLLF